MPDSPLTEPPGVVAAYDDFLRDVQARRWADRLTARMEALGVSSAELARRTGLSYLQIHRLRQAERMPSDRARLAIAVALGADVAQVFPEPELRDFLAYTGRTGEVPEALAVGAVA